MPPRGTKKRASEGTLRRSDQAVLKYLDELARRGDGEMCTASIPEIAAGAKVSERQVQISTRRLIEAGLLKRVGYDLSNADKAKRGTVYKVFQNKVRQQGRQEHNEITWLIIFLLDACSVTHSFIKQLVAAHDIKPRQRTRQAWLLKRLGKDMAELRRTIEDIDN